MATRQQKALVGRPVSAKREPYPYKSMALAELTKGTLDVVPDDDTIERLRAIEADYDDMLSRQEIETRAKLEAIRARREELDALEKIFSEPVEPTPMEALPPPGEYAGEVSVPRGGEPISAPLSPTIDTSLTGPITSDPATSGWGYTNLAAFGKVGKDLVAFALNPKAKTLVALGYGYAKGAPEHSFAGAAFGEQHGTEGYLGEFGPPSVETQYGVGPSSPEGFATFGYEGFAGEPVDFEEGLHGIPSDMGMDDSMDDFSWGEPDVAAEADFSDDEGNGGNGGSGK